MRDPWKITIEQALDAVRHIARATDMAYPRKVIGGEVQTPDDDPPLTIVVDNVEEDSNDCVMVDGNVLPAVYKCGWLIGVERGRRGRLLYINYIEKHRFMGTYDGKPSFKLWERGLVQEVPVGVDDVLRILGGPDRFVAGVIAQVEKAKTKALHRASDMDKRLLFLRKLKENGPLLDDHAPAT